MATFEPKTFTDFVERMTARVVARTALSDTEVGGVVASIIAGVAREFDDLHFQMVNLQRIWDIDTATGEDLDGRAFDVNPDEITRLDAVKANGTVEFFRSTTGAAVTVPEGTVVKTSDGVEYATTTSAVIGSLDLSVSVPAVAVVAGSAGNIDTIGLKATEPGGPTGISLIVGTVSGVEGANNDSIFTGGQDRESDPELRERIKAYLRSLSRGTPFSLKSAVLGTTLESFGRITTAEVEELGPPNLGQVIVYVDDGAGTIEVTSSVVSETVIGTAAGGEIRLFVDDPPIVDGFTPVVEWYESATLTTHVLTLGIPGIDAPGTFDYTLNRAQGKITLIPLGPAGIPDEVASLFGVAGLQPGDGLTASYDFYDGLVQEAQKIVDGDPDNRTDYPGYRAAGTDVKVLAPVVYYQTIEATVVVEDGYDPTTVLTGVKSAIQNYINGLPINGDVIASELIYAAQTIDGVFDVQFSSGGLPITLTNVIIGAGELARIKDGNITITGA